MEITKTEWNITEGETVDRIRRDIERRKNGWLKSKAAKEAFIGH